MFDMETPYLDMYKTVTFKSGSRPVKLHQRTCPLCDRKLVTVYLSVQLDKYICKNCLDRLMKEKESCND